MTRGKFLQELRRALEGNLPQSMVEENIEFYDEYIKGEVRGGREEEEVLKMLGDPWLLARTIRDIPGGGARTSGTDKNKPSKQSEGRANAPWKKIAIIAGVVVLILIVSVIIRGLLRFILPVAAPVLAVAAIIKIIRKK